MIANEKILVKLFRNKEKRLQYCKDEMTRRYNDSLINKPLRSCIVVDNNIVHLHTGTEDYIK